MHERPAESGVGVSFADAQAGVAGARLWPFCRRASGANTVYSALFLRLCRSFVRKGSAFPKALYFIEPSWQGPALPGRMGRGGAGKAKPFRTKERQSRKTNFSDFASACSVTRSRRNALVIETGPQMARTMDRKRPKTRAGVAGDISIAHKRKLWVLRRKSASPRTRAT